MAASSSKGIKIYLSKAAGGTDVVPTAITITKGVVELTATGIKEGDVLHFGNVGFPALDNKVFIAGAVTTGKVAVNTGVPLTDSTGALSATPTIAVFTPGTDLTNVCFGNIEFTSETPDDIQVATYCDPTATIPGATAAAGNFTAGGYVDVNSPDYAELLTAEADGKERVLTVMLPNNGSLVAPVVISGVSFETPIDGAIAYTVTGTLGSKLRHSF